MSNTVSGALREPGPMSPSRVAETLANGLAADPLFCGLLANRRLHLEHEVDLDRVVEIGRTGAAAEMSLADAIEQALVLGRSGALNVLLCGLLIDGLLLVDRTPAAEADRGLRRGAAVPPDWNLDFASSLIQLMTAACVGLLSESAERNQT